MSFGNKIVWIYFIEYVPQLLFISEKISFFLKKKSESKALSRLFDERLSFLRWRFWESGKSTLKAFSTNLESLCILAEKKILFGLKKRRIIERSLLSFLTVPRCFLDSNLLVQAKGTPPPSSFL